MQHAIPDGETRNYNAISSYYQCKIHRFCWIVARFRPEHQLEGKVKTIIWYPHLQTPDKNLNFNVNCANHMHHCQIYPKNRIHCLEIKSNFVLYIASVRELACLCAECGADSFVDVHEERRLFARYKPSYNLAAVSIQHRAKWRIWPKMNKSLGSSCNYSYRYNT